MGRSILFAIEEVGTLAYCLPLFTKWAAAAPPQKVTSWQVTLSQTVHASGIVPNNLPLITAEQAQDKHVDILVCSLSPEPQSTAILIKNAGRAIGILDTWKKSWSRKEYEALRTLAVIDEAHKKSLRGEIDAGYDIQIIGHPAWETVQPHPSPQPNTIAFIGQPIKKYYAQTLGYDEDSAWEMVEEVAGKIYDLSYIPHPEQVPQELPQSAQGKIVTSEAIKTHETIMGCFSSLMMDAYLGGRKTLSVQPKQINENRCSLSDNGNIPLIRDVGELRAALAMPQLVQAHDNPFKGSLKNFQSLLLSS